MIYFVISVVCAVLIVAVIMLCIQGRKEYLGAREEIDRAREEKNIIIEFLHKTVEDIGGGADTMRLYRRIVRATALSCGAMCARVYERQADGRLVAKATEGLFPPQTRKVLRQDSKLARAQFIDEIAADEEIVEMNEGIVGGVAYDGRGILIKDAPRDPRVIKHTDDSLKVRSIMVVPMFFGGNLYGVLAVANPISGKSFSDTDFSLAKSLGEQAAMSLYNMESVSALILKNKMEFDLRLASSVQQYLLPSKFPDTDSLEFAVKYIPQQLIGGDFYDFFKLSDDRFGVVVGDVSGKGVSAAILMSICKTKLRYMAQGGRPPSETLKELNAEMVLSMRTDMFITLIYAIVDTVNSKITLARAGHEPALLYRASGVDAPAEKISSSGMALGMVDPELFDAAIEDAHADFQKGDILVMYTDGVTESANAAGEEFSAVRLSSAVGNLGSRSASDLNDAIMASLNRFTENAKYADDLTLVSVKYI